MLVSVLQTISLLCTAVPNWHPHQTCNDYMLVCSYKAGDKSREDLKLLRCIQQYLIVNDSWKPDKQE